MMVFLIITNMQFQLQKNIINNATFYITTSFIDKNEMSWIDKIEHMIEKTKKNKKDN